MKLTNFLKAARKGQTQAPTAQEPPTAVTPSQGSATEKEGGASETARAQEQGSQGPMLVETPIILEGAEAWPSQPREEEEPVRKRRRLMKGRKIIRSSPKPEGEPSNAGPRGFWDDDFDLDTIEARNLWLTHCLPKRQLQALDEITFDEYRAELTNLAVHATSLVCATHGYINNREAELAEVKAKAKEVITKKNKSLVALKRRRDSEVENMEAKIKQQEEEMSRMRETINNAWEKLGKAKSEATAHEERCKGSEEMRKFLMTQGVEVVTNKLFSSSEFGMWFAELAQKIEDHGFAQGVKKTKEEYLKDTPLEQIGLYKAGTEAAMDEAYAELSSGNKSFKLLGKLAEKPDMSVEDILDLKEDDPS